MKFNSKYCSYSMRVLTRIRNGVRSITYVITNIIYYILYKINIITYVNYLDNADRDIFVSVKPRTITTKNFMMDINYRITEHLDIALRYYSNKFGDRIRTLDDRETYTTYIHGSIDNIRIRINDSDDYINILKNTQPRVNMLLSKPNKEFSAQDLEDLVKYETYRINVDKIRSLRNVKFINGAFDSISDAELKYYYDLIQSDYEAYFTDFSLNDVLIKETK